MPDGMAALFNGAYYWKMASDVRMEVGPTVIYCCLFCIMLQLRLEP